MIIANILVNIPARTINKTFSYIVPEQFSFILPGWRVLVPFGGRQVEGFVYEISDSNSMSDLKSILDVLDDEPWFDSHMLETAKWISTFYVCSLAEAMRLFIPGKTGVKTTLQYQVCEDMTCLPLLVETQQQQVYEYLQRHGVVDSRTLTKKFGSSVAQTIQALLTRGNIQKVCRTEKRHKKRFATLVELSVDEQTASRFLATLGRKPAQHRLLQALMEKRQLAVDEIKDLKISADTVNKLVASGTVKICKQHIARDSYAELKPKTVLHVNLTDEQEKAVTSISEAVVSGNYNSFLLHGVTGSGKTQVYLETVAIARDLGKQAIVLVPEIALTSQIVERFKARFGNDVVVIHSKLSVNERFDAWNRLRSGDAGIVIGARSAIFAPVADLGIVILDEEHEFTYKQEEAPRYHTREVALTRAKLAGATVVLGSATPAVETYYNTLKGDYRLLTLLSRVHAAPMPHVKIVDMRDELKQGRRSVISNELQALLHTTLARREQAVILLNRRGYSTFVLCRECGHVLKCNRCSVSLIYHASGNILRCHYCQANHSAPDSCPSCGSRYIRYFGTGTQRLEEELGKLFPVASIVRMDQDTTGAKMAHGAILHDFSSGKYDILLGTQMVAKGHDIPNVTAVGVITADGALNLPDFRAAERTFNLLTQAAGRAGRGDKPGHVVIQTYNPEHYSVTTGAMQDYGAFYETEIQFRRQLSYPPFLDILKLTIQGASEAKTQTEAEKIAAAVKAKLSETQIIGPFPAAVAKIKDIYRFNILLKTKQAAAVKMHLIDMNLTSRADILIDVQPVSLI